MSAAARRPDHQEQQWPDCQGWRGLLRQYGVREPAAVSGGGQSRGELPQPPICGRVGGAAAVFRECRGSASVPTLSLHP